ncbi:diacylglycerol O-acyltransferase 3-1 [Lotus japonicus]|uniref:diacylglycerol O-acyltransferase 3-1 n=1 Tax=Lotus japonicus TaxID=34305 RepID=UPI00258ACEAB|nr:diacylglycerol O-acyltransferase 3-1 [Lotus japonicus]
MDVSGTILRQLTYVTGAGTNAHSRGARVWAARPTARVVMGSGFSDEGHLQYYQDKKKGKPVVLTAKNKVKLLKRVSKGMSLFDELGFALDPNQRALLNDLQTNLTSDSGEGLLKELEKLRAEEKELKRKRKDEKKAKLKASKMKTGPDCESSSSSSSESSESSASECDEVVDMNTFRGGVAVAPAPPPALPPSRPAALLPETIAGGDVSIGSVSVGLKNENHGVSTAPQKRIEVCMGNKCKKSGAAALMQQFESVVGVEGGAVVGCKCMGKCKSAPNVRIQNAVDHELAEGLNDSVKVPANPLCIGVGLEDVDAVVARFLGENYQDMGMVAATT